MTFVSVNPATGQELKRYPDTTPDEVEKAVAGAVEAQEAWRETGFDERSRLLTSLAEVIRERTEEYAELMTDEMGKPIEEARSEAEKCAWVADWYAEHAEEALAPVPVETDASTSYWTYRPLGVVLAIMPWNFPFWQAMRFAVPTLAAGNAGLLKHASSVPGCGEALEAAFRDAGFPPALFRNLLMDSDRVGELIDDPRVKAVSLTGSVGAGRAVAERAGKNLKKCVLELGGSDPSVVLADADLDEAADSCVKGRLINNGQSCIAAKRFIVVPEIREAFQKKILGRLKQANARMGDPRDEDTRLGPLATEGIRDDLHDQVERSVEAGATLALGGQVPDRDGWWYPATLLTDPPADTPARVEELFGPVAVLIEAEDEDDALRIANETDFGLGAAVYTSDAEKGERIARDVLEAGNCFVNGIVKSDPRLPFGGIKESGYGRELSPLGIREFTNVKTVWVR